MRIEECLGKDESYLAMVPPFFKSRIFCKFGEEEETEMPLADVSLIEFIDLLDVIYPCQKRISDEIVEYVVKLAYQFQIQKHCLGNFIRKSDLKSVRNSEEKAKIDLFDRSLEIL
ncbi:hypothetical protein PENTCL1PPCAC_23280 [Pristionchus entomophagus]|uniref:BTB domain-containing protein n=1 Tax=Pristionchus entomophagus TaxID=358040 RepID=A0AAV5U2N6_9BILA|nr:hypothetical protein PENTCL1PPCAC_23280 [Pristionchus entomophagus]